MERPPGAEPTVVYEHRRATLRLNSGKKFRHNPVVILRSFYLRNWRACLLQRIFRACAVILCCLGSPVQAAGIQLFNGSSGWSGAIWYPCAGEPKHVELGDLAVAVDYGLQGVKDCPVAGAKLPLVVFSHGTSGWF